MQSHLTRPQLIELDRLMKELPLAASVFAKLEGPVTQLPAALSLAQIVADVTDAVGGGLASLLAPNGLPKPTGQGPSDAPSYRGATAITSSVHHPPLTRGVIVSYIILNWRSLDIAVLLQWFAQRPKFCPQCGQVGDFGLHVDAEYVCSACGHHCGNSRPTEVNLDMGAAEDAHEDEDGADGTADIAGAGTASALGQAGAGALVTDTGKAHILPYASLTELFVAILKAVDLVAHSSTCNVDPAKAAASGRKRGGGVAAGKDAEENEIAPATAAGDAGAAGNKASGGIDLLSLDMDMDVAVEMVKHATTTTTTTNDNHHHQNKSLSLPAAGPASGAAGGSVTPAPAVTTAGDGKGGGGGALTVTNAFDLSSHFVPRFVSPCFLSRILRLAYSFTNVLHLPDSDAITADACRLSALFLAASLILSNQVAFPRYQYVCSMVTVTNAGAAFTPAAFSSTGSAATPPSAAPSLIAVPFLPITNTNAAPSTPPVLWCDVVRCADLLGLEVADFWNRPMSMLNIAGSPQTPLTDRLAAVYCDAQLLGTPIPQPSPLDPWAPLVAGPKDLAKTITHMTDQIGNLIFDMGELRLPSYVYDAAVFAHDAGLAALYPAILERALSPTPRGGTTASGGVTSNCLAERLSPDHTAGIVLLELCRARQGTKLNHWAKNMKQTAELVASNNAGGAAGSASTQSAALSPNIHHASFVCRIFNSVVPGLLPGGGNELMNLVLATLAAILFMSPVDFCDLVVRSGLYGGHPSNELQPSSGLNSAVPLTPAATGGLMAFVTSCVSVGRYPLPLCRRLTPAESPWASVDRALHSEDRLIVLQLLWTFSQRLDISIEHRDLKGAVATLQAILRRHGSSSCVLFNYTMVVSDTAHPDLQGLYVCTAVDRRGATFLCLDDNKTVRYRAGRTETLCNKAGSSHPRIVDHLGATFTGPAVVTIEGLSARLLLQCARDRKSHYNYHWRAAAMKMEAMAAIRRENRSDSRHQKHSAVRRGEAGGSSLVFESRVACTVTESITSHLNRMSRQSRMKCDSSRHWAAVTAESCAAVLAPLTHLPNVRMLTLLTAAAGDAQLAEWAAAAVALREEAHRLRGASGSSPPLKETGGAPPKSPRRSSEYVAPLRMAPLALPPSMAHNGKTRSHPQPVHLFTGGKTARASASTIDDPETQPPPPPPARPPKNHSAALRKERTDILSQYVKAYCHSRQQELIAACPHAIMVEHMEDDVRSHGRSNVDN